MIQAFETSLNTCVANITQAVKDDDIRKDVIDLFKVADEVLSTTENKWSAIMNSANSINQDVVQVATKLQELSKIACATDNMMAAAACIRIKKMYEIQQMLGKFHTRVFELINHVIFQFALLIIYNVHHTLLCFIFMHVIIY